MKFQNSFKTAYFLVQSFKKWYTAEVDGFGDIILKNGNLLQWYKKVKTAGLKQFNAVVKMIKKHEKNTCTEQSEVSKLFLNKTY